MFIDFIVNSFSLVFLIFIFHLLILLFGVQLVIVYILFLSG